MKICHLYNTVTLSGHIQNLFASFKDNSSLDINTVESLDNFNAYIVELVTVDNDIALKLRNLFKNKTKALIYFLIPEKYNLMFFQVTYLLEAKAIYTEKQDTKVLVAKIKEDVKELKALQVSKLLGDISKNQESFLVFRNGYIQYVSPGLVEFFEAPSEEIFIKQILPTIDTTDVLCEDTTIKQEILDYNEESMHCNMQSKSIGEDTVVYFSESGSICGDKDMNFISSRVSFIELLKERLLQRALEDNDLSVMMINLLNMKKLQDDLDVVDLEEMLFELLTHMESILDRNIMFAQYERDSYAVLFENIYFREIVDIANEFHSKVLSYVSEQEYKALINVHSVDLKEIDFSEALTVLSHIKNNELTPDEKTCDYIVQSDETYSSLTEKDLLDAAYSKQTPIKILNIYHGLVINTPAKILKVSREAIQISFEQLQGIVINLEKSTVLQSSTFSQDIGAKVRQIDLKKKIAVLENFEFLRSNANAREYARVTTSTKIPITVTYNKQVVNGVILDLSIKSIAVQVRYSDKLQELKSNDVSISFNIPTKRSEKGYEQLRLGANVLAVTPEDENHLCKVICDLDEESDNESMLLEYVYERQKELIIELKKMSTFK